LVRLTGGHHRFREGCSRENRERLDAGTLELHGWYYDMETGTLARLDTQRRAFVDL